MKLLALFLLSLTLFACVEDRSPAEFEMVEVLNGATEQARHLAAAEVLKELMVDGFPDMSCTGDNYELPQCEGKVSPYELVILVARSEYGGHVYLHCIVHDDSRHPQLLQTCLKRIREKLAE